VNKKADPDPPLSAQDWQAILAIFHDVLERPSEERDRLVDDRCGDNEELKSRVRKMLLAHDSVGDDLLSGVPSVLFEGAAKEVSIDPLPGDQLGPYLLMEILGFGGMGVVYRALQERPVKREVALKLLQVGMATRVIIARFEAERQALAIMNHSCIAGYDPSLYRIERDMKALSPEERHRIRTVRSKPLLDDLEA
jgi:serine/threonine protein kinase